MCAADACHKLTVPPLLHFFHALHTLLHSFTQCASIRSIFSALSSRCPTPSACRPDWALAGAFAAVFGVQRLVPTFDASWHKSLQKPAWNPPNYVFPLGQHFAASVWGEGGITREALVFCLTAAVVAVPSHASTAYRAGA